MITLQYLDIEGRWVNTTFEAATFEQAVQHGKEMCNKTWVTYRVLENGVPLIEIYYVDGKVHTK